MTNFILISLIELCSIEYISNNHVDYNKNFNQCSNEIFNSHCNDIKRHYIYSMRFKYL